MAMEIPNPNSLDPRTPVQGVKVADAEMASLDVSGDDCRPEWNDTVNPRQPPKQQQSSMRMALASRDRYEISAREGRSGS